MEEIWWYGVAGKRRGPVHGAFLIDAARSGLIGPNTPVWRKGFSSWRRFADVFDPAASHEPDMRQGHIPEALPESGPLRSHPFRRFFARYLDLVVFGTVTSVVVGILLGVARVKPDNAILIFVLLTGVLLPLAMVTEAAFYGITKTTVGKSLFGLKVVDLRYELPLGFVEYLGRQVQVWIFGLGLGLPLISLCAMAWQAHRLTKGQAASYDEPMFCVRRTSSGYVGIIGLLAILVAIVLAAVAISVQ